MRTIVHMSDLHFGRVDASLIAPLIDKVKKLDPHLVVVSGDLTQRARSSQFAQARQFLDALPKPQIVVPGNHDIPLHNIVTRFLSPLKKYRRHISQDIEPSFIDEEIAVLGINTARSLTFKDGRINTGQMQAIHTKLRGLDKHIVKIIVTHHPFDLPDHYDDRHLVGRAPLAMQIFAQSEADLLLAGHLHISQANNTASRYQIDNFSAVVVQAGTATSTRGRGEANSFNLIRVEHDKVTIERFAWITQNMAFEPAATEVFVRNGNQWRRQERDAQTVCDRAPP